MGFCKDLHDGIKTDRQEMDNIDVGSRLLNILLPFLPPKTAL